MPEANAELIQQLEKRLKMFQCSPLFAQLADSYLKEGRAQEALQVCDKGISMFPFYSTAHLIRGKVLLALNLTAEARREFELVREFVPNNETVARLLAELPGGDDTLVARSAEPAVPDVSPSAPPEEPQVPEVAEAQSWLESQFVEPETPAPPQEQAAVSPGIETPPVEQPSTDVNGFGIEAPQAGATEDVFGLETPAETAEPQVSPEAPFGGTTEDAFGIEPPFAPAAAVPSAAEEDSFTVFTARVREVLSGTEDTLEFDEYLRGPAQEPPPNPTGFGDQGFSTEPEAPSDFAFASSEQAEPEPPPAEPAPNGASIEDFAEKLKSPPKITPVIDFTDKAPPTVSESETPASTGFVTPTLAEIYAKQGWYDDAIKAYKTLAQNKPAEREKFEARIAELEELKKIHGGGK